MNVHRFAVLCAVATLVLITAGGLVTSTGSGLAVPDWPLSNGTLFPPMVGGVAYEHSHRLVAAMVGILTVVLAVWLWRREPRAWVRRLALLAVAAIIAQGLLGGMTVLLHLPTAVSVLHACLAQAFLCLMVTIALVTSPRWMGAPAVAELGGARNVRPIALATTAAIYIQLILGALVRHTGSGLAIPDFPLALGRLIPPLESPFVAIHFLHRLGAVVVTMLVAATALHIFRHERRRPNLVAPGLLMVSLVLVQILLGAFTVWSRLAVAPTTAHVACGALLLATSLIVTLTSARAGEVQPAEAAPAHAAHAVAS